MVNIGRPPPIAESAIVDLRPDSQCGRSTSLLEVSVPVFLSLILGSVIRISILLFHVTPVAYSIRNYYREKK